MITLSIRYTINPNKLSDFRNYVEAEQEPIRRSGGQILGLFSSHRLRRTDKRGARPDRPPHPIGL